MTGRSSAWQDGQRGRRLAVLAAVLAFHVVLVTLWRPPVVTRWPSPASRPRSAPLTIRLLPLPTEAAPNRPLAAPVPAPRSTASWGSPRGPQPLTTIAPSTVIASPAVVAAPAAPDPPVAPAVTSAVTSASPPLDLTLPRAWQRPASAPDMAERARLDPRANTTRRPRLESALAAALSDERSTETLADGTQRIREGNRCTLVHPTRAAGLDPTDHLHNQIGGSEPCP